jgi:hypothetical protein
MLPARPLAVDPLAHVGVEVGVGPVDRAAAGVLVDEREDLALLDGKRLAQVGQLGVGGVVERRAAEQGGGRLAQLLGGVADVPARIGVLGVLRAERQDQAGLDRAADERDLDPVRPSTRPR